MKETLEISFDLTPNDLTHLQRHAGPKQAWRFVIVAVLVFLAFLPVIIRPGALHSHESRTDVWGGLAISLGAPLFIAGFWLVFSLRMKCDLGNAVAADAHRTARIAQDDFHWQDTDSTTSVQWRGIARLDQDDVLLYFETGKITYIIPKHAFSSAQDAAAFYQTACDYWRSAKNGTPAPAPTRSSDWPPPPGR